MLRKDDDIVGTMLHDVAHLIRLKVDEALKPFDLTRVAWLALGIIAENERLSQSQLAEALELGAPATGKLVDRLEDRGFVERIRHPDDRRSNLLTTTKEARRLLDELETVGHTLREDVLGKLTASERQELTRLLTIIKEKLNRRTETVAA